MANVEIDGVNSKVYTDQVDPKTGTTLTLGTSGDTVNLGSGVTAGTGFGGDLSFGGDTFGADKTVGANDAYAFTLETSGNPAIKMDALGHVTKPLQPAFLAYASTVTDVTGDGTLYDVIYANEVFDQNADYNTTTGIFTAPVTGRYMFSTTFEFEPDADHTTSYSYFKSSNRTIPVFWINPAATEAALGILDINGATVMDMDAGDTMYINWYVAGGSKTSDIGGGNTFGGYLIC